MFTTCQRFFSSQAAGEPSQAVGSKNRIIRPWLPLLSVSFMIVGRVDKMTFCRKPSLHADFIASAGKMRRANAPLIRANADHGILCSAVLIGNLEANGINWPCQYRLELPRNHRVGDRSQACYRETDRQNRFQQTKPHALKPRCRQAIRSKTGRAMGSSDSW